MKLTTTCLSIIALIICFPGHSQENIKGSSTLSQTGGPSFLTYDWSAQVYYVKTNHQVYVKISNWNIRVSPNSMYQYGGKQYSRTELGFSQWPCQDNSSGTTQITLTINASGKTFKVSISNDEGLLANSDELTNLNFNTYKVTGTSDFWVNGKGCREVEERILANQNQSKKENNSSTSGNSENSNSNSSSSSSSGNQNSTVSNTSSTNSSSESKLMTAEENMEALGIDPNEDYLGNTISMGATFIEDIFSMAAENRRKRALELERQIAEIQADYAEYKDNYQQLINKNIDSAKNGNLNSMLLVGWGNYRMGNSVEAEKWFKKLIALDQPIGYYYLGQMEEDKIVYGSFQGDKYVMNKNKDEQLASMLNAITFYKKSADLGFEEASNYLVCLYLELQIVGSWDGRFVPSILHAQINNKELLDKLNYCYHDVIEVIYPKKGLKNLEEAKKAAINAEKFGNYQPLKMISNYVQYYDNKASKEMLKVDKYIEKKDYKNAYLLCKKYADLYYIPAMTKLAYLYSSGLLGKVYNTLFFQETLLAAHLGDYNSMVSLSNIFKNGLKENDKVIVEQDIELSNLWMEAANDAKRVNTLN